MVNALSEWLEVTVHKHGKIHFQRYERGIPQGDLQVIGETDRQGTMVKFKPDAKIFETVDFVSSTELSRLKQSAYLTP